MRFFSFTEGKRKAGKKPAKRGEKGYPSDKAWKELTEDDFEEGND